MLGPGSVVAQRTCGTPLAIQQALQKNPALLKPYQKLLNLSLPTIQDKSIARGQAVAMIPVVVHVVLPNPASVTDAQIYSQITVLNEDYALLNADTVHIPAIWQSIAGDMKIQFCLAQRTPSGEPTNGIERVTTRHSEFSINGAVADVKHAATGGADAWNTNDYLNIWVCDLAGDNLGVGTPPGLYPADEQGVVIQYNAFGTTGNLLPAFNKGRSCTHEIGHFFNLLHLWGNGDGSCSPGDHVGDTPPQSDAVYGDQSFPYLQDPCSPNAPGIMINNYMGYTDDADMNMFTQGQVARAQAILFGPRASLLSSDACTPVVLKQNDARIRSVSAPHGKLCINQIAPVITLQNFGTEELQKVTISYQVDGVTRQTFHWSGALPSLDSIQIALPASAIAIGQHQFRVFTNDPNDVADEVTANDTLSSGFQLDPVAAVPFKEGFEDSAYPPAGWTLTNPDNLYTWQKTNNASHTGSNAVVMKNFNYQANGPVDQLISPVFNLQNTDSAFLFFDVAAALQSDPDGNNQYWDTLEVLISYDCGETGTPVYKKWGGSLATTTTLVAREFVPNAKQWRRDSINITHFIGKGAFRIIFRNITNFENDIYLDDIQVITRTINQLLKERKVLVVPNPVSDMLQVQFLSLPPDLQAVSIYNAAGQLIFQKAASAINNSNRITFNLANEPNGVYFVKISYSDKEIVKKIIKVK